MRQSALGALALLAVQSGMGAVVLAQESTANCPFCFRQRILPGDGSAAATPSSVTLSYGTATVPEGQSFLLSPIVSGGTAPYAYSVVGSPPAGFNLDPATGVLSGNLPAGLFSFGVMATPTVGTPATTVANVVVTPPAQPGAPTSVFYSPQPEMTAPGAVYVPPPTVSGGTAPYAYEVLDPVPEGLFFNADDGSFSGNPKNAGVYVIRVRVTSQGGGSTTTSVTFNVRDAVRYAAITDVHLNGAPISGSTLEERIGMISTKFWYPDNVGLPEGEQGYFAPNHSVSSYGDTTTILFTPGNVQFFKLKVFGPGPINACVYVYNPEGGVTATYTMMDSVDAAPGLEYGFGLDGTLINKIEVFPCAQDAEFLVWVGGFEMYQ